MKKLINKGIMRYLNKLFSATVIFAAFFSVLFITTPVNVYAQEVGFSECQFDPQTQSSDDVSIQNCLGQIFQFTFVVGMFIIAIRVALFALGNYNPFDNGKAVNNTINIVWEATLGFILLGSPVLIINVINPAALNLSFLQIGNIVSSQGGAGTNSGTNSGTGSNSTGSSGNSSSSINTGNGNVNANQGNQACNVAGSATCIQSSGALINPFGPLNAYAQEDMSEDEAIRIITDILKAESECKKLFVTQTDYENCQSLDSPDFVQLRERFTPRARELYTPLTEPASLYSGSIKVSRTVEVQPITVPASSTSQAECNLEYAVIKDTSTNARYIVSTENCPGDDISSLIWDVSGEVFAVKGGTVIEAGSEIVQFGKIQILNS